MTGARFIGLDLTDGTRARARPSDAAILSADLAVEFQSVRLPSLASAHELTDFDLVLSQIGHQANDVLVIDGPQGLATPGSQCRQSESQLRTPGRTPDTIDPASACSGRTQYLGYLYYSVLLFRSLAGHPGVALLDLQGKGIGEANLFEAFPGATWRVLRPRMPEKATVEGVRTRTELLTELGVRFPRQPTPLSHDQLDAAVCAWLGWATRHAPDRIRAVGDPVRKGADGTLREGRILDVKTAGGRL